MINSQELKKIIELIEATMPIEKTLVNIDADRNVYIKTINQDGSACEIDVSQEQDLIPVIIDTLKDAKQTQADTLQQKLLKACIGEKQ